MDFKKQVKGEITFLVGKLEIAETKQAQLEEFYKFLKTLLELAYNC